MTSNRVDRPDTIALALQIAAQLPPCHPDALEVLALAEKIVRLVHTEQTARLGTVLTLVE
jgi:hypothetical protein